MSAEQRMAAHMLRTHTSFVDEQIKRAIADGYHGELLVWETYDADTFTFTWHARRGRMEDAPRGVMVEVFDLAVYGRA